MTSGERVRCAFEHREADRVPVYEQTVCCRVASEIMGRRMHTGGGRIRWEETRARWESETAWQEYVGHLIEDVGDLIRELDFDLVGLPWRHSTRPSEKLDDFTFRYEEAETGLWSVFHYDENSDVFDQVDSAIRREGVAAIERAVAATERSAEEAKPPAAEGMAELLAISRRAGGERALKSGVGFIQIPPEAAWLEAAASRPDLIERSLDATVREALTAIPELPRFGVSVLWAGGDLASKGGPMYSPPMFRRFMLPRLKTIVEAAHAAGLHYLFRTDGDIRPIAQELLADSGIDGYGEIDVDAGMDPVEVKRRFPELTLWGGVSCGKVLVGASPEGVRAEVRRVLEQCKPGGGFILGSSNSIHTGIPTENFVAMQEAAREFGRYAA
ncbi:MAG TPA: uroporphyrinogen decarboxylase family protein [Armatimonadota bacterium]|nr:uroporphyrinogen decarboxylase family protein [Armatimonadota bacterium]